MKNIIFLSIIFAFFLNEIKTQTRCQTNLECLDTGCCHKNICSKASKCNKINKISYALVGAAGLILIVLNFLYFLYKVKKTRKVVLDLKKIDDKLYTKRRSSNFDLLKQLREKQKFSL